MDKKDEIIKLQLDLIESLTESNLSRMASDLWGPGAGSKPKAPAQSPAPKAQAAPAKQEQAQPEPPAETIEDLKREITLFQAIGIKNAVYSRQPAIVSRRGQHITAAAAYAIDLLTNTY